MAAIITPIANTLARLPGRYDALNRTVYDLMKGCINPARLPGTQLVAEGGSTMEPSGAAVYRDLGVVYWFYKHFLDRTSYDNKDAPLKATVHVTFNTGIGCSPNNAAWIGMPYFQMVYGDGDNQVLKNLALGFDVTGHEVTHALTSTTSNLTYRNESGALNEAMSDIIGSGIEAWRDSGGGEMGNPNMLAATANHTYLIGEDVAGMSLPGGALRFMDNPTRDMSSKDYYPERYTGAQDNGGVHWNSGIANLAFYLLAEGGRHPRMKTTTQVSAQGLEKALKIFAVANTRLFTASTDFKGARYATADAAALLYGRCSKEWANTHRAWDAVGVQGSWSLCVSPPGGL